MSGNEIRRRFLTFFEHRGHVIVPSASLVPENDPSVLFNTAGMQPLVPYLMGQPHPTGSKRIADSQKCLRTNDIDEVGDNTHLTFFEMLGNWSLGDYFKSEAINWSFEFITSTEEGLGLDPKRLYVTVFAGDDKAPRDEVAYQIWQEIFMAKGMDPAKRIFFMAATANWWSPGDNGPCGPDTEMFYDVTGTLTQGLNREEFIMADNKQQIVEIWNDVFMEYEKKAGQIVGKLTTKNVDTGSGLERITAMVQGVDNVFMTDLFIPIISKINDLTTSQDNQAVRIIADHIRASTFLIGDGVAVANTDQGYILRRLLRRSIRQADKLKMPAQSLALVAEVVVQNYGGAYPNLVTNKANIMAGINKEEEQFRRTLASGLNKIENLFRVGNSLRSNSTEWFVTDAVLNLIFDLYQSNGFPLELTIETIAQKRKELSLPNLTDKQIKTIKKAFADKMTEHQTKSRTGGEQKFKGGLADHSDTVVHYHTTTHLLLAALRHFLGSHIHQAGSNITTKRLRFDFTHPEKITTENLKKIEVWVNTALGTGGLVTSEIVTKEVAANDSFVEGSFWEKYPDLVTIYTITGPDGNIYSRELCGGPHVKQLADIKGNFKIIKEESSAAGVRRIKAVLA